MRFGSGCSGIEAASVAWQPLGWEAAWVSEIEPFPGAVLKHHYPDTPNYGDMTTLPDRILAGEVEAPDLFCGGTPCQAFSVAGLRRSLDDERGNLSLTFVEIADAIDDVRRARGDAECIVFWENVPGVLSTADNAFGCFLGALAGCDTAIEPLAATGWTDAGVVAGPVRTVCWRVLDAQFFGLAQRRRRVFVVASARDGFDPAQVLLEFEGVRRDSAPSREAGKGVARGAAPSPAGGELVGTIGCNTGPRGHGFGDFLNNQAVDAGHLLAFGGNRTSGSIDVTPAMLAQPGSGWKGDFESETFLVQPTHTLRGEGFDASEDRTGRGTPLVPVAFQPGNLSRGAGSEPSTEVFPTLKSDHGRGRSDQDPHVMVPVAFPANLSGTQCASSENLAPAMGAKNPTAVAFTQNSRSEVRHIGGDGQIVGALAADSGAQQQNYVATAVAVRTANTSANGHGISAELAHTLDQAQGQAVAFTTKLHNTTNNQAGKIYEEYTTSLDRSSPPPALLTPMQVRRLTPVECERLQGFPDGYTAIPWRGKPASECPDGPRYKALGNSWAVPVVRWIGRRIHAALCPELIGRAVLAELETVE